MNNISIFGQTPAWPSYVIFEQSLTLFWQPQVPSQIFLSTVHKLYKHCLTRTIYNCKDRPAEYGVVLRVVADHMHHPREGAGPILHTELGVPFKLHLLIKFHLNQIWKLSMRRYYSEPRTAPVLVMISPPLSVCPMVTHSDLE